MKRYIIFTLILLCFSLQGIAQNILLKANYHYDSKEAKFKGKIEVLIQRNKIVEIGKNLKFDASKTKVIDLGDATLLPGLIDSHTHLFIEEKLHKDYKGFGETVVKDAVLKTDAERVLEAAYRAKTYLDEGFTSIKDLGNSGQYLDVALKNAINKGEIEGSRLFVSGPGIAALGGQINNYNQALEELANEEYDIVNNQDEAIKSVRNHVLRKVDLIKLYADNIPNKTRLSIPELTAIVNEAKKNGLKVTAHGINNDAVWRAAKAGVNSVEHAYSIQDTTLTYLKKRNVAVIPTYSNSFITDEMFKRFGIHNEERRKKIVERGKARQRKTLQQLYKSSVTIVFGSDFYSSTSVTRGKAAKNSFYALLEGGIPLEKALQYATYNAGEHLNLKDKLGILKKNAIADIIAVKGNLKDNYKLLETCSFIMKSGKIIKQ